METSDAKSVKRLTKSLVGIIVSLSAFACGFATLVLFFGEKIKDYNSFITLIFLLALIPLIFIGVLGILVFRCTYIKKNYISFQASNKDNGNVSISVEKAVVSNTKEATNLLKEILELLPKTSS